MTDRPKISELAYEGLPPVGVTEYALQWYRLPGGRTGIRLIKRLPAGVVECERIGASGRSIAPHEVDYILATLRDVLVNDMATGGGLQLAL